MADTDKTLIWDWQVRLRLTEWHIGVSDVAPDGDDERSSVDIDRNLHRAVLRFDPTLPLDQRDRQIVHELLHVRMAELEDCFRQVVGDDETAATWWHRCEERMIEALTDALVPAQPRRDYRGGPAWVSAR